MGVTLAAMTAVQMATAASTAIAAMSAAVAFVQTTQQNRAEKKAANEYNERLHADAMRQYKELDSAEKDIIYESHASSLEAQRQLLEARSQVGLQAAVTGTYGNSVNIALQDIKTGFGGRMADITQTRDSQLDDVVNTAERIQANTQSRKKVAIKKPAFFSAIQTGLSTFNTVSPLAGRVAGAYKSAQQAIPGSTTGKTTGKINFTGNVGFGSRTSSPGGQGGV